jgi:hypothetical protein
VVVNGITAWQMLKKAKVQSGQTILIHGANGGSGNTLVQLARHSGIRVIGTASARHQDALRTMGAEPIDYNDPELTNRVKQLAPAESTPYSTSSAARASRARSSSWHPAERSWPTAWPPRGTTPTTCSSPSSERRDDLGSGAFFRTGVAPSFTTSGGEAHPSTSILAATRIRPGLCVLVAVSGLPHATGRGPNSSGRGQQGHDPCRIQDGIRQGRPGPMNPQLPQDDVSPSGSRPRGIVSSKPPGLQFQEHRCFPALRHTDRLAAVGDATASPPRR